MCVFSRFFNKIVYICPFFFGLPGPLEMTIIVSQNQNINKENVAENFSICWVGAPNPEGRLVKTA